MIAAQGREAMLREKGDASRLGVWGRSRQCGSSLGFANGCRERFLKDRGASVAPELPPGLIDHWLLCNGIGSRGVSLGHRVSSNAGCLARGEA
jgi:hypothetical protein